MKLDGSQCDHHHHHLSCCRLVLRPRHSISGESQIKRRSGGRQPVDLSKLCPLATLGAGQSQFNVIDCPIRTCQMLFIISFILSVSIESTLQSASFSAMDRTNSSAPLFLAPLVTQKQFQLLWSKPIKRSAANTTTGATSALIRDQLAELRHRLVKETNENAEQVALNSACLSSTSCQQSITFSHCDLANFTCACLPQHVPYNSTVCLPPSLLGFQCQVDGQCQQKVANSICQDNKCACTPGLFVPYRKDKCLSASKVDEFCLTDGQCKLNDRHSHCKWRIPNVYGLCKCPINYKLITTTTTTTTNGTNMDRSKQVHCAPRLGDACLTDAECLLATKNSICAPANTTKHNPTSAWPTSSASSDRCQCASGFRAAANQLDCVQLVSANDANEDNQPANQKNNHQPGRTNSSPLTSAMHHYDLLGVQQPLVGGATKESGAPAHDDDELDIKILDANTTTSANQITPTTARPSIRTTTTTTTTTTSTSTSSTTTEASQMTSTITTTTAPVLSKGQQQRQQPPPAPLAGPPVNKTSSNNNNKSLMSSLGKPCTTNGQCQLRDPNSFCSPAGVCDCLVASPRCGAHSTGCHANTFQCTNGQCISWYFVCDHFKNCDDGSDEDFCLAPNCPAGAFQCSTGGACITRGKLCDGRRDCPDGSDELQCSWPPPSPATDLKQQQLQTTGGSNLTAAGGCHPDAFRCHSGQCLPAYVFCNAVEDCLDGSDEPESLCDRKWPDRAALGNKPKRPTASELAPTGTATTTTTTTTTTQKRTSDTDNSQHLSRESPLVKTDRAAIERLLASLALASRTPESRGRPAAARKVAGRRSKLMTTTTGGGGDCPRDSFTCRNGKCRSSAILCSGVDGCGDNSDEDHCEVCQCPAPPPGTSSSSSSRRRTTRT